MRLAMLVALWCCVADAQTATRIEGLILDDATEAPLSKAVVLLDPGYAPGTAPYAAVTDLAGRFSIPDIRPSKYSIKVERGGYLPFPTGATIDIRAGQQPTSITLKLTKQGIIAGRLVNAAGLSSKPSPVRLWKVTFARGYRTAEILNPQSAEEDGSFMIGDLAPGRYYLEKPSASLAGAIELDVTAGITIRDVEIRSRPAARYRISGVARNPQPGSTMQGNKVWLETRTPFGSWVALERSARIHPDTGAFTFYSVPPGDYRLSSRTIIPIASSSRSYFAMQGVSVDKQSATGIPLEFTPMAVVTGTVSEDTRLAPRAKPIYVSLYLSASGSSWGVSTEVFPNKTFRLQVIPGQYRIFCGNGTENARRLKAILFKGRRMEVGSELNIPAEGGTLQLILGGPGPEIVGAVRDAAGRSVAGAKVVAWAEPNELETAVADGQGRFFISNAPYGQLHIAAWEFSGGERWMLPSLRTAILRFATKVPVGGSPRVTVELTAMPRTTVEAELAKLR